jgi:Domain of unknown function (DUF4440)
MKATIIFTLAVLMAGAICSQGQKRMSNSEELIRQLDKKLTTALIEGDSASVDAILGNNYVEINAQGEIRRKSEVMAEARIRASTPPSKSAGPEISEEIKLQIDGDTVILIGLKTTTYQHMEFQRIPGADDASAPTATNQERFIKVYAKVGERWQLVAFQSTMIAQSQTRTTVPASN